MTVFYRLSRFGMTYKPLTENRGEELLTLYRAGFHAKTSAQRGGGAGIDGERSGMWREMARIIYEVQPRFAFVENSPMLTSRGLGTVLGDLAAMGFDAKWGVLGADSIGANHQRNRIWIVGKATNAMRGRSQEQANKRFLESQRSNQLQSCESRDSSQMAYANSAGLGTGGWEGLHSKRQTGFIAAPSNPTMAQPECEGLEGQRSQPREQEVSKSGDASALANSTKLFSNGCNFDRPRPKISKLGNGDGAYGSSNDWWQAEPNVGRVANGVAARVDRLKAIGNGQVPLCAATAWRILQ